MDDPLLQGARALQASIAGEGLRLPPVSRSLQQIEDETRALASVAARAPAATAMAYRFLTQQGIDADGLDAATLDMAVDEASADLPAFGGGADATAVDAPACDVDSLLAREQCRALVESVRRAGELVTARYDAAYWSSFEEAWGGTREQLLRDASALGAPPPAVLPTVAQPGAAAAAAAPMRSRSRTARELAYGGVFARLLALNGGAGATGDISLFREMGSAAKGGSGALDSTALKLVSSWRLLAEMAETARPLLHPGGGSRALPADEGPYRSTDAPLRLSLLRGALSHFGEQARTELRARVAASAGAARRGGEPGIEFEAAAALRLERGLDAPTAQPPPQRVTLAGGDDAPFWPLLYLCLRCADYAAAARVSAAAAAEGAAPPRLSALLAAAAADGSATAGAGVSGGGMSRLVLAAQEEYWRGAAQMEPHARLVYASVAAPDAAISAREIAPERERTVEDWLWHKLSAAHALLAASLPPPASAGGHPPAGCDGSQDALGSLQRLVYGSYGETYFNAGGGSPLLYAGVLLATQQFERAVAVLAAVPHLRQEAVHFGLALQHEGLLAVAQQKLADSSLLVGTSPSPSLALPPLVAQHVGEWASEGVDASRAAIGYLWLLRGPAAQRQELCIQLLLGCGKPEALLPRSGLSHIAEADYRELLRAVSSRLAGKGRASQAARLLYEAREHRQLSALLVAELSANIAAAARGTNPAAGDAAERAARLCADAAAFAREWRDSDPQEASAHGAPLFALLSIAQLLEGAEAWRAASKGLPAAGPRGATDAIAMQPLSALLVRVEALSEAGLLPASLAEVEAAQAEYRLQPPEVRRAFPQLVETCVELLHAQYVALRIARCAPMPAAAGARAGTGFAAIRAQAEALVVFGGAMDVSASSGQRIARWLAEMS